MTEVRSELIYEVLKNLQGDMSQIKLELGDVRHEIVSMRLQNTGIQTDIHNIYGVTARMNDRLDRIEGRLELRELAEPQHRFDPNA